MKSFGGLGIRFILGIGLLSLIGCTDEVATFEQNEVLIQSQTNAKGYNTAANLMATALRETEKLDIVLYPRDLVERSKSAVLTANLDVTGLQRLMSVYPDDIQDQFKIGTMRGRDIKRLIESRSTEVYRTEVDVAGLLYHIHFIGGFMQYSFFSRPEGQKLNDNEYYRVAISQLFFFNGLTFPSYKYRNGLNFSFRDMGRTISAKEALTTYLASPRIWPDLKERRATVTKSRLGENGYLPISQIQGTAHRSPVYGQKVTTRGIVTAVGNAQWYPGGVDVIIQSLDPDTDPRTAEGLLVYLEKDELAPTLGAVIEVRGVVYEQITSSGLGMTSLHEVESIKDLQINANFPEPILLGQGGRAIPNEVISTWRGELNLKPSLELTDGIDFWESLEGMRVQINSPRVVGFRGGQEDFESRKPKNYLTLYVRPDGHLPDPQESLKGGILVNHLRNNYNPHVLQISTNHLTAPINAEKIFNVGQLIPGQVDGVLIYQKNMFGGGEFNLVMPQIPQAMATAFANASAQATELKDRPITSLVAGPDQLTVATFNVENLGGNQTRRLKKLAEAMEINLRCPDIVNFVEIQDENGASLLGQSAAAGTLDNLIALINCPQKQYKGINIDPITNAEGGQPGGNIRVAVMYDAKKVSFTPRSNAKALDETLITADGKLSQNPGRVFPMAEAFSGVRRSLVTEFQFKNEQIILIGNHFNSKLGDTSVWDSVQPPYQRSEDRRIPLSELINKFVDYVMLQAPKAHVIVAGDFNALEDETSMKVLEGDVLKNLMLVPGLVDPKDRYSTNYNGNSQCIDHVFVNQNLLKRQPKIEILHLNSDYMSRLADHDPIVTLFHF